MSLIYSVLKPVLKKATVKKADMTREDFIGQAEKVQKRGYTFPEISGFYFYSGGEKRGRTGHRLYQGKNEVR